VNGFEGGVLNDCLYVSIALYLTCSRFHGLSFQARVMNMSTFTLPLWDEPRVRCYISSGALHFQPYGSKWEYAPYVQILTTRGYDEVSTSDKASAAGC
jgi:hypothetical protein